VLVLGLSGAASADKKPKLTLKANPSMAISPANIHFAADLTGGANDDQEFYCPGVEWDWGDGTRSEESADCDAYVAGKTEITRHFSATHTYRVQEDPDTIMQTDFRVQLRLKKSGKVIASAGTNLKVRPGIGLR
jgi:hypothetical protein